MELAKSNGMVHIADGIHMLKGERYYPTRMGWVPVINYNWKEEYRKLERNYENLQILHDLKAKENMEMRDIVKTSNPIASRVWKIVQGHLEDEEKLRAIKRFLLDKKKGGD